MTRAYLDLVESVLQNGEYKPNRTGVDTISSFGEHYRIDLSEGFPLLTTKDMGGPRWNSLVHEFLWYLSGEHHIGKLREETSIWDAWADDDGYLDTAYGRFWRRYPVPGVGHRLYREEWTHPDNRWLNDETPPTFDQIQYAVDQLWENPNSRRIVVNAWHPANAAVSTLPPCHYSFVFNVQGDRLNTHLMQRSGDVALGIPFNIASYALLTHVVAQRTGFEVGTFAHSITDAHIYCGKGDRGAWYDENLGELRKHLWEGAPIGYRSAEQFVDDEAPTEAEGDEGHDHVPGLLRQAARVPFDRPTIDIADKPIDDLVADDIELREYRSQPAIPFEVAE